MLPYLYKEKYNYNFLETHEDDKNDEDDDEMVIIEKHTYTPEQNMVCSLLSRFNVTQRNIHVN